jgi:hypothetical protein
MGSYVWREDRARLDVDQCGFPLQLLFLVAILELNAAAALEGDDLTAIPASPRPRHGLNFGSEELGMAGTTSALERSRLCQSTAACTSI